jgi:SAM-dependent methyltransferase
MMSNRTSLAPVDEISEWGNETFTAFRTALRGASYTDSILKFAEGVAPGMFDHLRLPLVNRALQQRGDAAATLARLFAYDDAIDRGTVRDLLGTECFGSLESSGILTADSFVEGRVRSTFRLLPLEGLWILSDRFDAGTDCVMGPGPTTVQLIRLLPERIAGSVLDVGCGAGSLVLVAASRGASPAVGTDLNGRALETARFNARLNGLEVDFRQGDLLEPVINDTFDLVVAQPPYVPHPPGLPAATYLHGGPRGDELAMRMISDLPRILSGRGHALILMDTAARKGDLLSNRMRALLGDAPIDLVVLAAPGASADLQSIGYALLDAAQVGSEYSAAVRRYRDHMEALGIEEFRHCLVIARSHAGGPQAGGRFTVQLRVRSLPKCASVLDGILGGLDLAALDDASLRRRTVRAAGRAQWVDERETLDRTIEPTSYARFPSDDFLLDQEISEAGRTLIETLSAESTIDDAIDRYATICGATPEEVGDHVLDFVREGLSRGTLEAGIAARQHGSPRKPRRV